MYNNEELNRIYDRTDGYCHLCYRKLSFCNYGCFGTRGAWEVEHSVPRSLGGTEHPNNLYAACIQCNREKAIRTSRTIRSWNGRARAPRSRARKNEVRRTNIVKSAAIGGIIGSLAGPPGLFVGLALGAKIGSQLDAND